MMSESEERANAVGSKSTMNLIFGIFVHPLERISYGYFKEIKEI